MVCNYRDKEVNRTQEFMALLLFILEQYFP